MQENNEENLSIKKRISQIIDYYKLSRYKFSKETGISESVLLNIYKGKNKPGFDFLLKLLHRYEGINANWLLTGEGEMLRSDALVIEKGDKAELPPGPCRQCEIRERLIQSQLKTIEHLEARLESDGQKRKQVG